jgi:hypothetical protein
VATQQFQIEINGESPLLMHHDNLSWAEKLKAWGLDPANKKTSVAGDDRSPAHRWIGNLYTDAGKIVIPADNLMTLLREGGKKLPTGKGMQSFKTQTQAGIVVDQAAWPLLIGGKPVSTAGLAELCAEKDFERHEEYAVANGYELFCKRARVGASKHVRVRPLFRQWAAVGSVTVFDDTITKAVLAQILAIGGRECGLGDWRPSSPKSPGPYGKFTASVEKL